MAAMEASATILVRMGKHPLLMGLFQRAAVAVANTFKEEALAEMEALEEAAAALVRRACFR